MFSFYIHLSLHITGTNYNCNRIDGVMVSVLSSNAVDRGFEPRSAPTKDNTIGICCFFSNYVALRIKNKE
jgi:hypothetical protein